MAQEQTADGGALNLDGKTTVAGATTPVPHGEGQATRFKSLDLSNPKDVALLRSSVKRRWPGLDEDSRAEAVECLKAAMRGARSAGDLRLLLESVKTYAVLEGQHQADEHLAEKNARLDEGLPTDGISIVAIPPPVRAKMDGEHG